MSLMTSRSASPDFLHQLGIFPLFSGQVGAQQQIVHANHAIHGRPYFVAHVGQEFAFQPRRFLSLDEQCFNLNVLLLNLFLLLA